MDFPVVALDPSLTCTGVADTRLERPYTLEPPESLRKVHPMARLRWIQQKVEAATRGAGLVVIEGYAYGKDNKAHQLGELGGVIRLTLYCLNRPYVDVPPAVRAKLATSSGNGKKNEVFAQAVHRLGYAGTSFDEADALWLLQTALQHYALPGAVQLPKSHLERGNMKSKAIWPKMEDLLEKRLKAS